ncbi:MAG: 30S ribosomal protein S20 [Spirochaetaceae bacterium]|nr:30S ribosomal protein S20 [Spirochaetaceae bacterium]
MAVKQSSAEKRHKQSEVRRLRNKSAKSSVHTSTRKYIEAVHAKDAALAAERLKALVKELDTVAGKGIISKNSASRKKSRMMKLYNTSFNTAAN